MSTESMSTESLAISKAEKLNLFYSLAQDPEIQPDIRTWFDGMLATSELNLVKRIAALETTTGLYDFSDLEDEEEHEPTIPEQISVLAEKIDNITITTTKGPLIAPIIEPVEIPTSRTGMRALLLVEHLKTNVKEISGSKYISSAGIARFLKSHIPEDLQQKKVRIFDR